jgi:hypothetical protein
MSNVKTHPITNLRANIYDAISSPGITTITRSGQFAGVFLSLGNLEPKIAKRLHQIIRHNPRHGIQTLTQKITGND